MTKKDCNYFSNPILPGFYPDPSICRVNDDYYLVTSSFTYFPGLPIFHSKDLVNWKQIGHALERTTQLNLDELEQSQGIYAPTIRYNKGLFYIACTNVGKKGNFIITAEKPEGPWSEPYWLEDAPGIDPSLFFDDDGKIYFMGTNDAPDGTYYGDNEIWMRELDTGKMQLTGPRYGLWRGAMKNAVWPEGPHIYKINGYYYLMIAEGGTDYHHSVTIARSKCITGPYEGCKGNPILTHRHLGRKYPIANVGHADLIETQNGEWWMVALASRPYGGYYRNLGRETFLIPVTWEDGWPVVSPLSGKVEFTYERPKLPSDNPVEVTACDHFDNEKLGFEWNFVRTPRENFYSLTDRPGHLRLKLRPVKITEQKNPGYIGRRQQHINFRAKTIMEFSPENKNEAAGILVIQNNNYHMRLECTRSGEKNIIRLVVCTDGKESIIAQKEITHKRIHMVVQACGQDYSFYFGDENQLIELAFNVDGRILSTDVAGGFIGTYVGMFASSNGYDSRNTADFDLFEYSGL
ncbi:glycoside hydrolase family 43 protein [Ruminiclostridium papyrosolvens]|uniref:Arabinofuranosidase n=1 Tax=Ruminiclostridium papyrosolvens C7 TaxID=1330534 RepID=U4R5F8_9FIRM|nr:glycoside hydrolase family 43 protein [Ruminiclostridium papyrosolvens]EPR13811.1 arabinofuranosidase [Ruminiclostridium papyrosolvens C7]